MLPAPDNATSNSHALSIVSATRRRRQGSPSLSCVAVVGRRCASSRMQRRMRRLTRIIRAENVEMNSCSGQCTQPSQIGRAAAPRTRAAQPRCCRSRQQQAPASNKHHAPPPARLARNTHSSKRPSLNPSQAHRAVPETHAAPVSEAARSTLPLPPSDSSFTHTLTRSPRFASSSSSSFSPLPLTAPIGTRSHRWSRCRRLDSPFISRLPTHGCGGIAAFQRPTPSDVLVTTPIRMPSLA